MTPAPAMPVALEIAVTSPAGAIVARDAGADRVELCVGLELGGLTPSQALVEATHETGIPAHALVRCRPGGFTYDADELALMEREVRTVLRSGAAGVVVGALRPDRSLDEDILRRFVDAARSVAAHAEVTLHRAVDHAADPVATAARLADLGITRVLTSGGAASAPVGAATIARMVDAAGPVQVMAGAGHSRGRPTAARDRGRGGAPLRQAVGHGRSRVSMGSGDDGSAHRHRCGRRGRGAGSLDRWTLSPRCVDADPRLSAREVSPRSRFGLRGRDRAERIETRRRGGSRHRRARQRRRARGTSSAPRGSGAPRSGTRGVTTPSAAPRREASRLRRGGDRRVTPRALACVLGGALRLARQHGSVTPVAARVGSPRAARRRDDGPRTVRRDDGRADGSRRSRSARGCDRRQCVP